MKGGVLVVAPGRQAQMRRVTGNPDVFTPSLSRMGACETGRGQDTTFKRMTAIEDTT